MDADPFDTEDVVPFGPAAAHEVDQRRQYAIDLLKDKDSPFFLAAVNPAGQLEVVMAVILDDSLMIDQIIYAAQSIRDEM